MSTHEHPPQGKFAPGDNIKVIDGTFVGAEGKVISPEEAVRMWEVVGGQKPTASDPEGKIWVVIPVFEKEVPVLLEPFQITRR